MRKEFLNATNVIGWNEMIVAVKNSERLLKSLWDKDEKAVAAGVEKVHKKKGLLRR